ncbi:MAG: hypothetical protein OEV49_06790 [candidate division Zixibacteria bacterium]|nr:hypothetical protein [candidate division Zixibacteria bacterium]
MITTEKPVAYITSGAANSEAHEAALWLGGELLARQGLYDSLTKDFELLRSRFGDSIPCVNTRFHLPWKPSMLIMGIDHPVEMRSYEWNGITIEVDSVYDSPYSGGWFLAHFNTADSALLNSNLLVDTYGLDSIPDVRWIQPNGHAHLDLYPSIHILIHEDNDARYFFVSNSCSPARLGFRIEGDSAVYLGEDHHNDTSTHDYWHEFLVAAGEQYGVFRTWIADTTPPVYACDTISLDFPEFEIYEGSEEARGAALLLSGSLIAPKDLHDRIAADLQWIRENWPDSLASIDSVEYRWPWYGSGFKLAPADITMLSSRNSPAYWPFRCISEHFGGFSSSATTGWIFVRKGTRHGHFHPARLMDAFSQLPGITSMESINVRQAGNDIYVEQNPISLKYYFHVGSIPPHGLPENQKFYYFLSNGEEIRLVGSYSSIGDEPDWMESLRTARDHKYRRIVWTR